MPFCQSIPEKQMKPRRKLCAYMDFVPGIAALNIKSGYERQHQTPLSDSISMRKGPSSLNSRFAEQ